MTAFKSPEKDRLRLDRDALVEAVKQAGGVFKRANSIVCPFHTDHSPSAGLYRGEDGVWRFKCLGCGVCEDIIGVRVLASNRKVGDVLRDIDPQPIATDPLPMVYQTLDALKGAYRSLERTHVYTNPKTRQPDMVVLRLRQGKDKSFVQCRPHAGGFVAKAPEKPWPIYNRIRIIAAQTVIVVEGEGCVEELSRVGHVATTSPGGALKGKYADWSLLAGKKVYLWPDFDPVDKNGLRKGFEHMREVREILERLEPLPEIWWIDPTPFSLPPKGDVVDYVAIYGGKDIDDAKRAVQCAIETAEPLSGSHELHKLIEDTISGKRKALLWPWPVLGKLSQALLPGTVTAICGDPGCGKSFMLIEAVWFWFTNGYKPAVFMLEEELSYHLMRTLAQIEGCANVTESEWVHKNGERVRHLYAKNKEKLDEFSRCISAAPKESTTLPMLAEWVADRALAGCQVIAIDPITAAVTGDKRFIEDLEFMNRAKAIVRETGSRLVITTHPRNNAKGWTDMTGGAAYPRFAQSVFWVHRHDGGKPVRCQQNRRELEPIPMAFHTTINRSIKLGKTRNGKGAGREIGFIFDARTLRFAEQGLIVTKDGDTDQDESPMPRAPRVVALQDPFIEQEVA